MPNKKNKQDLPLKPDTLLAGILEPVFAIRTEADLGIGDTEGVRQMIDWCAGHGLNIFQTLPINETRDDNSPYNAISSIAIDPGTIAVSPSHLPDLLAATFEKLAQPQLLSKLRRGRVDYPKVKALKRALLEEAFDLFFIRHWQEGTKRAEEFRRFLRENASWLSGYALFRALMEENAGSSNWEHWPEEQQTPAQAHIWLLSLSEKRRVKLEHRELFFSYVQWIAFGQWQALKNYAGERRVYLMGDIPFGVARSSADAWAHRDIFDLDWSGGAPPEKAFKVDAFTRKWGQNWGIPNYRWDVLRRRNFDWWRMRITHILRYFHLYRIDHALGFFRIYSFPWTPDRNADFLSLNKTQAAAKTGGRLPQFKEFADDTPKRRKSNQRHGEELLRMVLDASGTANVIAEDLGVVPPYVPVALRKLRIPGFRIPMFVRERDGAYSDPKKYPRLSLIQPATHDHPPLAAAWEELWRNIEAGHGAENRRELRRIMEFASLGDEQPPRHLSRTLLESYLRRIASANSWLAVVMITDVFGQTGRFNSPGAVADENWSVRMAETVAEISNNPELRAQGETFGRLMREAGRGLGQCKS